jgi:dipeptidyl aminopeptidase/acylaminoacyl peptidase
MEAWCDMLMGKQRKHIWSISPAHNVKNGLPPAVAFHGEEDDIVALWTVISFQNDMKKMGNHFELIRYPGRKHYLGDIDEKYVKQYARLFDEQVMQDTDKFLEQFGFMESK